MRNITHTRKDARKYSRPAFVPYYKMFDKSLGFHWFDTDLWKTRITLRGAKGIQFNMIAR